MSTHTYLDHGLAILNTRLGVPGIGSSSPLSESCHPFITISRETGAGATTLGQHLLPLLEANLGKEGRNWTFLDKNLITHALTQNRLPESLAKYLPEERVSELTGLIGEIVGLHPPLWELEQRVSEAIFKLARVGCVIFAGRAAHLVTRSLPDGFHIRLVAPLEVRIARMQDQDHLTRTEAERKIEELDRARRRYVLANFGKDIDDPRTYDLVINTGRILPATAAQMVLAAMVDRIRASAAAPVSAPLAHAPVQQQN